LEPYTTRQDLIGLRGEPAFDGDLNRRSRLLIVRRFLALMLALIVAVCSAAVSSPHVHAYGGHDHPEHQHGPTSHGHDHHDGSPAIASHDDGHGDNGGVASFRIEGCDAGDHAVRLPGTAAPVPQSHVQLAVLSGPIVVPPVLPARLAIARLDVRVHGPPPDTHLPARAPPLTFLA
jgi:hypothetical protein